MPPIDQAIDHPRTLFPQSVTACAGWSALLLVRQGLFLWLFLMLGAFAAGGSESVAGESTGGDFCGYLNPRMELARACPAKSGFLPLSVGV